jgi:hypothetical protein
VSSLDEQMYRYFKKLGTKKEVHFSRLVKVGGIGGWRTRVSVARQWFKREGKDITNRQERVLVRGRRVTHSYYRLVKAK